MTISTDDLTPGQRRTAAARATRAVQANTKAAARLRSAGYVVLTRHQVLAMAESVARSTGSTPPKFMEDWARGFGEALKAIADVSDATRE